MNVFIIRTSDLGENSLFRVFVHRVGGDSEYLRGMISTRLNVLGDNRFG